MVKHLTIAETAGLIGKSVKATKLDISRGRLPFRRLGRRIIVPSDELERFLTSLPTVSAEQALAVVLQSQQKEAEVAG